MSKSVVIRAFGDPEVLTIEDVIVAEPGPGEVRLQIKAIGINRTEITFRSGRFAKSSIFPVKIGFEAAGLIESVGPDVEAFQVGDRVALIPAYGVGEYGLYGELSLAPASSLVRVPDAVGWTEAAATWVAFATAWGGLVDLGRLEHGQTVLLPAASSSVGLAAIQVARIQGARPIALSRTTAKATALLDAGAEAVIATDTQDVVAEVMELTNGRGADLVFDPVGGSSFSTLVEASAPRSTLILYGVFSPQLTEFPGIAVLAKSLSIKGFALPSVTKDEIKRQKLTKYISEGLASGHLHPTIAKTFDFDQIADAHRYVEKSSHFGKVVVTV